MKTPERPVITGTFLVLLLFILLAGCTLLESSHLRSRIEMSPVSMVYNLSKSRWTVEWELNSTLTNMDTKPAHKTVEQVTITYPPLFNPDYRGYSLDDHVYKMVFFDFGTIEPRGNKTLSQTTTTEISDRVMSDIFEGKQFEIDIDIPGYRTEFDYNSLPPRSQPTQYPQAATRLVPNCGNSLCLSPDVCCNGVCLPACPSATISPVSSHPTSSGGLLVWYDFEGDFVEEGTVKDISGNGYDATVVGYVGEEQGIAGKKAITFSGTGFLQASRNPVAGRKEVTFSLWFKTDDPTANYKLASAAWWHGGPGSGWILATHIPEFWSDDTKGLYLPDIQNLDNHFAAARWNHEAVTYDGTRIREYTNGKLINDWKTTGAAIGTGNPMAVGSWPDYGFFFQGALDDFRIYDHVLTQSEISALNAHAG